MIGLNIQILRIEKGYSINELSKKANVSKSYLSSIERGIQSNPSLHVLHRLAESLDTTIESILGESKNEESTFVGHIDDAWIYLLHEIIQSGMTIEEFSHYLKSMKFKNKDGDSIK